MQCRAVRLCAAIPTPKKHSEKRKMDIVGGKRKEKKRSDPKGFLSSKTWKITLRVAGQTFKIRVEISDCRKKKDNRVCLGDDLG
ncbi:MAG: hypothetical protein ACLVKJ_02095 [Acutalibacteraceae bacterium]|jgi:hypothetical protein